MLTGSIGNTTVFVFQEADKVLKRFVTIFPRARQVHLGKGVGQIPYTLQQDYGYHATLVCHNNGIVLREPVKSFELKYLPGLFGALAPFLYVIGNARSIDVLNVYHHSRISYLLCRCLLLLNSRAKVYLKLDINTRYLRNLQQSPGFKRNVIIWNKLFKSSRCIVSCETKAAYRMLAEMYPALGDKLLYMPNGFALDMYAVPVKSFEQKENIMITVGRIGAYEKNPEFLLEVLKNVALKQWRFYFIGPVEPHFQPKIAAFFQQNPGKADNIFFTGEMHQPVVLAEYYNKARVFCLSSRSEGFATVLAEALHFGNYIISTPVDCAYDITANNTIGKIVPGEHEYARVLQAIVDGELDLAPNYNKALELSKLQFNWPVIVQTLYQQL